MVLVSSLPPPPDGIGDHTLELARALAATLGSVGVSVLARRGGRRGAQPAGAVEAMGALSASPAALWRSLRALAASAPDVVHYQFNLPSLGAAWAWAILAGVAWRRRHPRTALVFTLHEVRRDLNLLGPGAVLLYRVLARLADGTVVYTDEARRILVERCGVSPARVTVMVHPSPQPAAALLDEQQLARVRRRYGVDGATVLFFGYLHPDKGIETLIEAVDRLARGSPCDAPRPRVLIAGSVRARRGIFRLFELRDRCYQRRLVAEVDRRALRDTVRFADYVPDVDVAPLLAQSTFAVLPYRDVTQSGVLARFVASALPAIVSELPGLGEAPEGGTLGFPPGDAEALAERMHLLLGDPEQLRRMREAMTEGRSRLGVDAAAAQLLGWYDALRARPA